MWPSLALFFFGHAIPCTCTIGKHVICLWIAFNFYFPSWPVNQSQYVSQCYLFIEKPHPWFYDIFIVLSSTFWVSVFCFILIFTQYCNLLLVGVCDKERFQKSNKKLMVEKGKRWNTRCREWSYVCYTGLSFFKYSCCRRFISLSLSFFFSS